jgi:hypothetical protein
MTPNQRFDELLWMISRLCLPIGLWGDLDQRLRVDQDAIESLREEDIRVVFDLIGYDPPRELRLESDAIEAHVVLFLGQLADEYPDRFLATLEQRIGSIPTALPLIDGAEDVNRTVGRAICEWASSRRCLTPAERALLKERCATIGCRYPFSDATFDPAWRTSDVLLLAQGIYDAKTFDRMPILADALQDAGCDSEYILGHCRDTALAHVRGCWVVDLVLGKS